jgi:NAD(P)-dependent dehydrogenase (short-subunit alcohol dehydrogenase family)
MREKEVPFMTPWHSLADRTIFVIGGAGYLGSPITAQLDSECKKVLCLDLPGKAEELVARRSLGRTVAKSIDVTQTAAITAALDALVAEHGVPDGLVHLAFTSSSGKTLESLTADDLDTTFCRGVTPTFLIARHLAERMKTRGRGSIVLFGSMYGMVAPDPRIYHPPLTPNPIDYGASKAAIIQMTRTLAVHYGPFNVRVNCVTPGPFPNPTVQQDQPGFIRDLAGKTALGRIGASPEIVGPTLFLLSDGASYMTGQSLVVDGGWTIW